MKIFLHCDTNAARTACTPCTRKFNPWPLTPQDSASHSNWQPRHSGCQSPGPRNPTSSLPAAPLKRHEVWSFSHRWAAGGYPHFPNPIFSTAIWLGRGLASSRARASAQAPLCGAASCCAWHMPPLAGVWHQVMDKLAGAMPKTLNPKRQYNVSDPARDGPRRGISGIRLSETV